MKAQTQKPKWRQTILLQHAIFFSSMTMWNFNSIWFQLYVAPECVHCAVCTQEQDTHYAQTFAVQNAFYLAQQASASVCAPIYFFVSLVGQCLYNILVCFGSPTKRRRRKKLGCIEPLFLLHLFGMSWLHTAIYALCKCMCDHLFSFIVQHAYGSRTIYFSNIMHIKRTIWSSHTAPAIVI